MAAQRFRTLWWARPASPELALFAALTGCSLDGDPAEAHMKFHVAFCRAARRVLFRLCQGS
jgi:hypothetical protein